jgi:hypothetical protein
MKRQRALPAEYEAIIDLHIPSSLARTLESLCHRLDITPFTWDEFFAQWLHGTGAPDEGALDKAHAGNLIRFDHNCLNSGDYRASLVARAATGFDQLPENGRRITVCIPFCPRQLHC